MGSLRQGPMRTFTSLFCAHAGRTPPRFARRDFTSGHEAHARERSSEIPIPSEIPTSEARRDLKEEKTEDLAHLRLFWV